MLGKISSVTKSRREKTAFLVSESFAVDVISHLSISTCINDDEDDDDDDGDGDDDDDDDDAVSYTHLTLPTIYSV